MYFTLRRKCKSRVSKELICFAKDNNGLPKEFEIYYFPHILPEVIFALINIQHNRFH